MTKKKKNEIVSPVNRIKNLTDAINDLKNPKYSEFLPQGLDVEIEQLKEAVKVLSDSKE